MKGPNMNQIKLNNLDPVTKTHQRTEKDKFSTTKYIIKMKDMQRIEERIRYNKEGVLTEIHIQFSDETSRKPSEDNPDKIVTFRDEISYTYYSPRTWMSDNGNDSESVSWSTGWQSDLAGKLKEANIRQKALKYFAKRKAQLVK